MTSSESQPRTAAEPCYHPTLVTYRDPDGVPRIWACNDCKLRFSPGRAEAAAGPPASAARVTRQLTLDDVGRLAEAMFDQLGWVAATTDPSVAELRSAIPHEDGDSPAWREMAERILLRYLAALPEAAVQEPPLSEAAMQRWRAAQPAPDLDVDLLNQALEYTGTALPFGDLDLIAARYRFLQARESGGEP